MFLISKCVFPNQPFQPSVMFVGKALVLYTNIWLGLKGLPGTNNLVSHKYL